MKWVESIVQGKVNGELEDDDPELAGVMDYEIADEDNNDDLEITGVDETNNTAAEI